MEGKAHAVNAAKKPYMVVVGGGRQPYREYSFAALATDYRVCAVSPAEAAWQRPYLESHVVADVTDPEAIAAAVSGLAGDAGPEGIGLLTWDESLLEPTAQAAFRLGVPHMSPEAAARCQDKFATRTLMAEAGMPAVQCQLVRSPEEAESAAEEFGYPVVVKPRSLTGGAGVRRAGDGAQVRSAFAAADAATHGRLPTGQGVLIEEYLAGPEICVDSVVFEGTTQCVHVAYKELGFPPYFQAVGYWVTGGGDAVLDPEVSGLVQGAHKALGIEYGITQTEIRLTAAGPRLVELNGRLSGDLIPYLGRQATGVDLLLAAAEITLGRRPDLTAKRDDVAEIRFVYPPQDCTVTRVDLTEATRVAGIAHAALLAPPGTRLLLPPHSTAPRMAALVAVGADEMRTGQALDIAERGITADVVALEPSFGV
jgi:biotin carboxylase